MSEADDAVLAEIIESAKAFTSAKTVSPETRLLVDLGMDGDDAEEFLSAFAARYDVDMSSMVWLRYFGGEPTMSDMLTPALILAASVLSPAFAVRWQAARQAEREVTIAHLAKVARAKVWLEPSEPVSYSRTVSALALIFSTAAMLILVFFVVLGVIVVYGLLTGQMGEQRVLALVGVAAMSILFPVYCSYAAWRSIGAKLASAGPSGAS